MTLHIVQSTMEVLVVSHGPIVCKMPTIGTGFAVNNFSAVVNEGRWSMI
jgi:hypothetical protein